MGAFPCPHYLPQGLRGRHQPFRGRKKETKNVFPSLSSLPFHSHARKPPWTLPISPVILQAKVIFRVNFTGIPQSQVLTAIPNFFRSILGQTQSCARFSAPSWSRVLFVMPVRAVRSCCLFWFVYTQCIQFASLFFLSVQVKHLNKVTTQNFALFRYRF